MPRSQRIAATRFDQVTVRGRPRQEAAHAGHGVDVDVLVFWDVEEPGAGSDVQLDRADRLEQQDDAMPLNIVASGMFEDRVQAVAVVAAEMGGQTVLGHAATIGPGP